MPSAMCRQQQNFQSLLCFSASFFSPFFLVLLFLFYASLVSWRPIHIKIFLFSFLCHSEFSSEAFSFYSRPFNRSWNKFRMTDGGLNFFLRGSHFFFMGGESATKTFPINGRGEWKSLNASPIGGSGFSVRPNIRTFYPKLFLPFLRCQSPAFNLELEWTVWAIGDRVEVVAGGATCHAFLFFRNVAEVRGIVANTAFALVKDWFVHGIAGGCWRYTKFWKRLFYRGQTYCICRWNYGCWHHQHQSKN